MPSGAGVFRRVTDISALDGTRVVAWMEDDFHHFGVTITHDGQAVTNLSARAERAPWSTCSGAAFPLRALIGKPLIERASDIGRYIDMRLQCTHMFDLAGLALAHAFHHRSHRRYEAVVDDRPRHGATHATLSRDDTAVMAWDIEAASITAPPPHAGHSLNDGFRAWTETLPTEEAEYAFVLRRAIMVSNGRHADLDSFETAAGTGMPPVCHTYQPGNLAIAMRNKGSTRNYERGTAGMLGALNTIP